MEKKFQIAKQKELNALIQVDKLLRTNQFKNQENLIANPISDEQITENLLGNQFPNTDTYKEMKEYLLPAYEPDLEEVGYDDYRQLDNELHNTISQLNERQRECANKITELENDLQELMGTQSDANDHLQNLQILYLKNDINRYDLEFRNIEDRKNKAYQDIDDLKKQKDLITKKNKEKIDLYRDELNLLNNNAFQTAKDDNESNEEYLQRLQHSSQQIKPQEYTLDDILANSDRLFKIKLKEIIRSNVIIEQICNSLSSQDKMDILQKWKKFKTDFTNEYGTKTILLNIDKVLDFVDKFIKNKQPINYSPINYELLQRSSKKATPNKAMSVLNEDEIIKSPVKKKIGRPRKIITTKSSKKLTDYYAEPVSQMDNDDEEMPALIPQEGFGISNQKYPEFVLFGDILIKPNSLLYHNILSVKHKTKQSINGFKNIKVSDKMVDLLMDMINGNEPSSDDISKLNTSEKQIYDKLINLGKLHKKFPNNLEKTIHDYKKRLKILEGEIEIGNNNPDILKEIKSILNSLYTLKKITKKQQNEYLKQFI